MVVCAGGRECNGQRSWKSYDSCIGCSNVMFLAENSTKIQPSHRLAPLKFSCIAVWFGRNSGCKNRGFASMLGKQCEAFHQGLQSARSAPATASPLSSPRKIWHHDINQWCMSRSSLEALVIWVNLAISLSPAKMGAEQPIRVWATRNTPQMPNFQQFRCLGHKKHVLHAQGTQGDMQTAWKAKWACLGGAVRGDDLYPDTLTWTCFCRSMCCIMWLGQDGMNYLHFTSSLRLAVLAWSLQWRPLFLVNLVIWQIIENTITNTLAKKIKKHQNIESPLYHDWMLIRKRPWHTLVLIAKPQPTCASSMNISQSTRYTYVP